MDKYVITQEYNYGLGIGYAFKYNNKEGRIAIFIDGEITPSKIGHTFRYLNKVLENPEDCKEIVWGKEGLLIGSEVLYKDIEKEDTEKGILFDCPYVFKDDNKKSIVIDNPYIKLKRRKNEY